MADACVSLSYVISYSYFLLLANPRLVGGPDYFRDKRTYWFILGVILNIFTIALGITRISLKGDAAYYRNYYNRGQVFDTSPVVKACELTELRCVLLMQTGMFFALFHGVFRGHSMKTFALPFILAWIKPAFYM